MSEPEAEQAEAEVTIDTDAIFELALEKAKELVEEGDDFTRAMRMRSMTCRELMTLAEVRGKFPELAVGDHIDAIDEAIIRVCATMGDA